jgi:hypothetical protein
LWTQFAEIAADGERNFASLFWLYDWKNRSAQTEAARTIADPGGLPAGFGWTSGGTPEPHCAYLFSGWTSLMVGSCWSLMMRTLKRVVPSGFRVIQPVLHAETRDFLEVPQIPREQRSVMRYADGRDFEVHAAEARE